MKQKLLGVLKYNLWWIFSKVEEELRYAALTATEVARCLFWCTKKGLKMEGAENQGSHLQNKEVLHCSLKRTSLFRSVV